MTLSDFYNMMLRAGNSHDPIVYVFDDETEHDNYRNDWSGQFLFVIQSTVVLKFVLKEKYSAARVCNFFATGEDQVDVIIDV